jgi:hypothetical protein
VLGIGITYAPPLGATMEVVATEGEAAIYWQPTARNPDRRVLRVVKAKVRPGHLWPAVPDRRRTPLYYLDHDAAYSTADLGGLPSFRLRGRWLYPAEGFPTGPSGQAFYRIVGRFRNLGYRPPDGTR